MLPLLQTPTMPKPNVSKNRKGGKYKQGARTAALRVGVNLANNIKSHASKQVSEFANASKAQLNKQIKQMLYSIIESIDSGTANEHIIEAFQQVLTASHKTGKKPKA